MGKTDNLTAHIYQSLLNFTHNPGDRKELDDLWDQFIEWEQTRSDSSFTSEEINYSEYRFTSTYERIRTRFLATVLIGSSLLGVAINIAVIFLALRNRNQIQASRAMLVVNLCCACLLFLLGGIPLLVAENVYMMDWTHTEIVCQLHRYIVYVSFCILGYSLVLLLLHVTLFTWIPLRLVKLDKPQYICVLCLVLWLLVLLSNIPNYLSHGVADEIPGYSYCYAEDHAQEMWRLQAWTVLQFTFTFAVPFVLMVVLTVLTALRMRQSTSEYSELHDVTTSRQDVFCLCVALTVVFLLCWFPDKVFSLVLVYDESAVMGSGMLVLSDLLMCFAYSNPSVNPVIVLFCLLRHFLPCVKCRRQETSTTEGVAVSFTQSIQSQDVLDQSPSPEGNDDKMFKSVV